MKDLSQAHKWRLFAFAAAMLLIFALGCLGYVDRKPITETIIGRKLNEDTFGPNISISNERALRKLTADRSFILGFGVSGLDFKRNERHATYKYFKVKRVDAALDDFLEQHRVIPIFGSDEGNNRRMVDLINGQFTCSPIDQTIAGQLVPIILDYAVTACVVPIPPGAVNFAGFITVYLVREPPEAQMDQLEADMRNIAANIYALDILRG